MPKFNYRGTQVEVSEEVAERLPAEYEPAEKKAPAKKAASSNSNK